MSTAVRLQPDDVLLVIDVQNDFCPGGALPVPEGDQVVPVINRLAARFPHAVVTKDWHPKDHVSFAAAHPGAQVHDVIETPYGSQVLWPEHCVQATRGAELHPDLDLPGCELVLHDANDPLLESYSGFFANDHRTPTGLNGYLRERGLKRLFLAGLATDFCVQYTALDARRLGFDVFVIEDGCRGIDLEGSVEQAWRSMAEAGVVRIREVDLGVAQ